MKRRVTRRAFVALCFASLVSAQDTGAISGDVSNAQTQEPIKNAHVILNGRAHLSAITDSSGSFTFRALPVGTYALSAYQFNYYSNPFETSVISIRLADAEEKRDVRFHLISTATIAGRVVDADGEPVANCEVGVLQVQQQMGQRLLWMPFWVTTDEQGAYRLRGLQQGRYSVRAQCWDLFPAPHGFMPRNDPLIPHEGYPPGVYSSGNALHVTGGQELSGIDLHVKRTPLFSLLVTVKGGGSQPLNVILWSREPGEEKLTRGGDRKDPNTYSFLLPAGSYTVDALLSNQGAEARQDVEIGKTPMTRVTLTLSAAFKICGSVEYDDPTKASENPPVFLTPLAGSSQAAAPQGQSAADGTLEFAALPGRYGLDWKGPGYVKRMTVGGQEVSPRDFAIGPGTQFHIVVGTKAGKLQVDLGAKPSAREIVSGLLISETGELSQIGRNIAAADPNGRVLFPNVAPGKYRLAVIPIENPGNLIYMPDLLKALAAAGKSIEMSEGDDQHTTAKVMPADDLQKLIEAAQ